MAVNTIGILIGIVWLLAQLAIIGAIVYLFVLIVKALKNILAQKKCAKKSAKCAPLSARCCAKNAPAAR